MPPASPSQVPQLAAVPNSLVTTNTVAAHSRGYTAASVFGGPEACAADFHPVSMLLGQERSNADPVPGIAGYRTPDHVKPQPTSWQARQPAQSEPNMHGTALAMSVSNVVE
jgi:hypothetical protein